MLNICTVQHPFSVASCELQPGAAYMQRRLDLRRTRSAKFPPMARALLTGRGSATEFWSSISRETTRSSLQNRSAHKLAYDVRTKRFACLKGKIKLGGTGVWTVWFPPVFPKPTADCQYVCVLLSPMVTLSVRFRDLPTTFVKLESASYRWCLQQGTIIR